MKLKRIYKPDKDFVERTKHVFLHAFNQKFGPENARPSFAFRYFSRGLATGIAIMVVVSGGAAYADQKNVGPDSVLYPLKRTQELVNLTFSSVEDKPVLHLKFAERRLEEIEEVTHRDPSSGKIAGLAEDLRREFKDSLSVLNHDELALSELKAFESGEDSEGSEPEEAMMQIVRPSPRAIEEAPPLPSPDPRTLASSSPPLQREALKNLFDEKSGPSICESFKALLFSQNDEIEKIIGENSGFLEKFEKKCLPVVLRQVEKTLEKLEKTKERSSEDEKKSDSRNRGKQERQKTLKVEEKDKREQFLKDD